MAQTKTNNIKAIKKNLEEALNLYSMLYECDIKDIVEPKEKSVPKILDEPSKPLKTESSNKTASFFFIFLMIVCIIVLIIMCVWNSKQYTFIQVPIIILSIGGGVASFFLYRKYSKGDYKIRQSWQNYNQRLSDYKNSIKAHDEAVRYNETLPDLIKQYKKDLKNNEVERKKYREIKNKIDQKIGFLPSKYQKYDAIHSFYNYICDYRAENLKEAINLYEKEKQDESYRDRMLQIEEDRVSEIRKQSEMIEEHNSEMEFLQREQNELAESEAAENESYRKKMLDMQKEQLEETKKKNR